MILLGRHIEYWKKSFIFKKINENNEYWNSLFITDHLEARDILSIAKNYNKYKKIFCSLESSVHGLRYYRPYRHGLFNITHKNVTNSLYYNIFAEDYLNNLMGEYEIKDKTINQTIFVSSNVQKINYVQNCLRSKFLNINLYGSFSKRVPSIQSNFHLDSRILISDYKSAICIENSMEDGYIQGNFLFALLSGTVPIIGASKSILQNLLLPESYLSFDEFCSLSDLEINKIIDQKSEYLLSGGQFFTNLAKEYLDFVRNMNMTDIHKLIIESQFFRNKIFKN